MFAIDRVLFAVGGLLLLAIFSRKIAQRFGVPMLVIFVFLGMLTGSEGLGGIDFENYTLAHATGTAALAIILFDGGLRTPIGVIRRAWKPALTLATLGVFITAGITGLVGMLVFDLGILQALLLGSIVASTDAAAVFASLRSQGVRLPPRLAATLEFESGSNDPMAVFLTISFIQVIQGEAELGLGLLGSFVLQMSVGGIVGIGVGQGIVWIVNRIRLDTVGMYPLIAVLGAILAYGAAATFQGSGFLAAYAAGIVMGNRRMAWQHGTWLFADTAAWFAQIVMFVLLGLLSTPSALLAVAWEGTAVALTLAFVARPLAVFLCLAPFRFSLRELTLISWVGLRGAVPIVIATYPLLFGLPSADRLFDVVFFAVLLSALTQGWSMPLVARRLGLALPIRPQPPISLEIASVHATGAEIVDYEVGEDSRAVGKHLRDLDLPEGAVAAIIVRGERIVPPRGSTQIESGDRVFVVTDPDQRARVTRAFRAAKA